MPSLVQGGVQATVINGQWRQDAMLFNAFLERRERFGIKELAWVMWTRSKILNAKMKEFSLWSDPWEFLAVFRFRHGTSSSISIGDQEFNGQTAAAHKTRDIPVDHYLSPHRSPIWK